MAGMIRLSVCQLAALLVLTGWAANVAATYQPSYEPSYNHEPPYEPSHEESSAEPCALSCDEQGNPFTACWKCLSYSPFSREAVIDFSGCFLEPEGFCCISKGCKTSDVRFPGSSRALLQAGNVKRVKHTGSAATWQQSSKRQKRRAGTATWHKPIWRYCPTVSDKCCIAGADSSCAQQHLCEVTINPGNPKVCPQMHSRSPPLPTCPHRWPHGARHGESCRHCACAKGLCCNSHHTCTKPHHERSLMVTATYKQGCEWTGCHHGRKCKCASSDDTQSYCS